MASPRLRLLLSLCVATGVATLTGGCWSHSQYLDHDGDGRLSETAITWNVAQAQEFAQRGRHADALEHWRKAIRGGARDYDVLVQGSRCASRLALRREPTETGRAGMAREALAWAEAATEHNGTRVQGLFAQALALGLLSESSMLESSVGGILDLTTRVIAADERFAQAGGLRMRGLTYLRAPDLWGGDLDQALEDLTRAAQLFPAFAENRLAFAEALLEDDDLGGAREQLVAAGRCDRRPRVQAWYQELLARLEDS